MAYTRRTWHDGRAGGTPVDAAELNRIEDGIEALTGGSLDPVITINSYDANGMPTSVTTDGVTTTYTYNSDGTPHTQTRLGVTRTYAYSGGQLVSIS